MRSFYDAAPEISKNVPMLIGSVSEEGNRMSSRPTEAEWHSISPAVIGDAKATALIAAMKKAHPEKSIRTLILRRQRVAGAQPRHANGHPEARLKAAPVFAYYFTWQSPMLEDAGAWHTAELAFCFDNTSVASRALATQRGAETGKDHGHRVGDFRAHGQSQPAAA